MASTAEFGRAPDWRQNSRSRRFDVPAQQHSPSSLKDPSIRAGRLGRDPLRQIAGSGGSEIKLNPY